MYLPRKSSISSALAALCAAALLTIVTALPDAVHANAPHCATPFVPSIQ